jgi:peroxiredoxin 5
MPSMLRFSIPLFMFMIGSVIGFHSRHVSLATRSLTLQLAMAATREIAVGDMLPTVTLTELKSPDSKPETVDLTDLCKGKTVAIFGVPGAFTPGCSKSHLPSFITASSELQAKGVEMTICVATNDAFVMEVR